MERVVSRVYVLSLLAPLAIQRAPLWQTPVRFPHCPRAELALEVELVTRRATQAQGNLAELYCW